MTVNHAVSQASPTQPRQLLSFAHLAIAVVFVAVLLRTAWICDDAYISFRTVDNFVHGFGLTWNVTERVQTFTNPLWTLLLSAGYYFFHDIDYLSLVASILFTLWAVWITSARLPVNESSGLIILAVLLSSKAFMDYSTSGLESPLGHALLALFFLLYFSGRDSRPAHLFLLALIAGLAVLNRMDNGLLYAPVLAILLFRHRSWRTAFVMLGGFLPFILWEVFALVYYGSLVPNTAFAKLSTGVWSVLLIQQGLSFLLGSLSADPITLIAIMLSVSGVLLLRAWRLLPLLVGLLLYLLYVVKVGGDFMGGRFLSTPFLMAVVMLARLPLPSLSTSAATTGAAVAIGIGLLSPMPNLLASAEARDRSKRVWYGYDVSDTRADYYWRTGLLLQNRKRDSEGEPRKAFFPTDYKDLILNAKGEKTPVVHGGIGLLGFHAGPGVYIVDAVALSDPFLARLPAIQEDWRMGHFRRPLPLGYIDSLKTGQNLIRDPKLARLYDLVRLQTRAPLWSSERWKAIATLNWGDWQSLAAAGREPALTNLTQVSIADLFRDNPEGTPYYNSNLNYTTRQVEITLGHIAHASEIEITIAHRHRYSVEFLNGKDRLATVELAPSTTPYGALKTHRIAVPVVASGRGYDRLRISAMDDDEEWERFYSLGNIKFNLEP